MTTPSQVYYANPCNSALCGRFLFQTCSEVPALPAGVKQVKAPTPYRAAFRGWCADQDGNVTHLVGGNGRVWHVVYLGAEQDKVLADGPFNTKTLF